MPAGAKGGNSQATKYRQKNPAKYAEYNRKRRAKYRSKRAPLDRPETLPPTGPVIERKDWARAIIAWAPSLTIPSGLLAGRPFTLPDWQADWIRGALAEGIVCGNLSCARKSGKTGLIALIVLFFLAGPGNRRGWRGATCNLKADLAKELARAVTDTAIASGLGDQVRYYSSPAPGRIEGRNGAELRVLSADKSGGESLSNDLVVCDEIGLFPEAKRPLVYGLRSSLSARDGLMLCISVRGDSALFGEYARMKDSPGIYWKEYRAAKNCRLDDEAEWLKACPSLGTVKSLEAMRELCRLALENPANQNEFCSRELNQPLKPADEPIVGWGMWQRCLKPYHELPPREGPVCLGIDLGRTDSMCAAAALWPSGRMEVWAAFPANQNVLRRGDSDGVGALYQDMVQRGELRLFGADATPIGDFLHWVASELTGEYIAAAGADLYRKRELVKYLEREMPAVPVAWRGIGARNKEGSSDVRSFQTMVLKQQLFADGGKLILSHAIQESALRYDEAGNPVLDKHKAKSRIDGLQAAVISCGLHASGWANQPAEEWEVA